MCTAVHIPVHSSRTVLPGLYLGVREDSRGHTACGVGRGIPLPLMFTRPQAGNNEVRQIAQRYLNVPR